MTPITLRHTLPLAFATALYVASPASASEYGKVYAPLGSNNSIAIIDTATHEVTGKISGVRNVHGLAKTPDGRYLIAGSYDERSPDGPALVKPNDVSPDEHAAHHAKSPIGGPKTVGSISTVSVIRLSDLTVTRRIDVPGAVHHVAVDPTGRNAIVTHPSQDTVSFIDLKSYEVVATIATGPLPNYAAFSPDGRHVYVSNAGNNTVSDVDVAKKIVLRTSVVGESPEHIVLSRDGASLFVNNVSDGTVSVLDVKRGQVTRTYKIGSTLHGIDLSDDGKTLFVASLGDDKVASVDVTSGTIRTKNVSPAPYHLATIHGTGKIYVSSAEKPIAWVIDQTSLKVEGEIAVGGKAHQMIQVTGRQPVPSTQ